MVLQKHIKRKWSFSEWRIMLMYYVNLYTFLEDPEKDWAKLSRMDPNPPPEELLLFS